MDHVRIHKVIRSRRRTIALVVGSDATLTVRAPLETPVEYLQDVVRRKLQWIKNKIAEVEKRPPVGQKSFVNGESFLYLGDSYRLRIVNRADAPLIFRREFVLARDHVDQARDLLVDWYKTEAQKKIAARVVWHARRFGLSVGPVRISGAQKRWGSCGKGNRLNFSWRLIMAPLRVIDYVVIHELAHTVERSHSRDFWRKVAMMCPSYRSGMDWLKKNEHLLQI
jgi:predicted metal-dependent hydrolase